MTPFFQDGDFSSALIQALDYAAYGGADIGECLGVAEQIRDGDCESWHIEWIGLAERVRRQATQELSGGRQAEARDAFLRAARYYRTAGHFLDRNPRDARISTTAGASTSCFTTAMRLSAPTCDTRVFNHNGARYTAYLHQADDARPRATLLVAGEAGATPLEMYFSCVVAANRRGWHCFTVSGGPPNEAVGIASSLITEAVRLAPVDPACLALMSFREEPTLPPGTGSRRLACPWGVGNAEAINVALQRETAGAVLTGDAVEGSNRVGALGRFHQHLFRWLDNS